MKASGRPDAYQSGQGGASRLHSSRTATRAGKRRFGWFSGSGAVGSPSEFRQHAWGLARREAPSPAPRIADGAATVCGELTPRFQRASASRTRSLIRNSACKPQFRGCKTCSAHERSRPRGGFDSELNGQRARFRACRAAGYRGLRFASIRACRSGVTGGRGVQHGDGPVAADRWASRSTRAAAFPS